MVRKRKKKREGSHQKWISCDEPDESKGGACSYDDYLYN
jgi:hypothetical protein